MLQQIIAAAGPAAIPIRLTARIIDYSLLAALGIGLGSQVGFGYGWLIVTASLILLYFVAGDAINGQTLGKAIVKLKVVGPDGAKPTVKESLAREWFVLLGAVPFAGPFLALGAWIWMALTIRSSPLAQGWHDRLAGGTRVVRIK
jgi:uncharacterized RDD family membrane protein YckC